MKILKIYVDDILTIFFYNINNKFSKYEIKNPKDFNWIEYISINKDLQHLDEKNAIDHYINRGIYENRPYKNILLRNFNLSEYTNLNKHLFVKLLAGKKMREIDIVNHYLKYGSYENTLPKDFNWNKYIKLYDDLKHMNEEQAKNHYIKYGYNEGRIYKINNTYNEFNYPFYIRTLNSDNNNDNIDTPIKAFNHYNLNGNTKYDNKINIMNRLNVDPEKYEYFYNLDEFVSLYYPNDNIEKIYETLINNPKVEYRYFCYRYLNYIRQYTIPELKQGNIKETVLIEFRPFPHLEFLIRNTIHKLGNSWSYTIVCGHDNKKLINTICSKISLNIRIILLPYNNITLDQYSLILASNSFWNLFQGEKILLYQEDSCIFNKNIDEFLEYDYIGAPWPKHQNDNEYNVGNGGLSLRF